VVRSEVLMVYYMEHDSYVCMCVRKKCNCKREWEQRFLEISLSYFRCVVIWLHEHLWNVMTLLYIFMSLYALVTERYAPILYQNACPVRDH